MYFNACCIFFDSLQMTELMTKSDLLWIKDCMLQIASLDDSNFMAMFPPNGDVDYDTGKPIPLSYMHHKYRT